MFLVVSLRNQEVGTLKAYLKRQRLNVASAIFLLGSAISCAAVSTKAGLVGAAI